MTEEFENIYIFGKNPIEEALQSEPERIEKIYIKNTLKDSQHSNIFALASANRIPISHVPSNKLFELVGNVNDQGLVALMSTIEYQEFEEWIDEIDTLPYPAILILDGIVDPHNLGAILRTAAAANISAVLVPKHGQAPINATVFKTSAGTAGKIPIVRMGNLNQSIIKLKDIGFWIAGLDMHGDLKLWDVEVDRPLAFVLGNEGAGVSKKTLEHCDYNITIPMANNVESLNASVSAALICYEWNRKSVE